MKFKTKLKNDFKALEGNLQNTTRTLLEYIMTNLETNLKNTPVTTENQCQNAKRTLNGTIDNPK